MPQEKAELADVDGALLKAAEAALDALSDRFFAASAEDQFLLKPQVVQAANGVLNARVLLLAPGILGTEEDVKEAKRIKKVIDKAASTQKLILGAARLIAFLAKL